MTPLSKPVPRWNEVSAVFGGRFDPPHLGHREAVKGLFEFPGVKEVVIMPSPAPPHKPAIAGVEDRLEMAKLNFKSTPAENMPLEIRIDTRELERFKRHPERPTYSFDTLCELQQENLRLAFVIGADQLSQLHTWYRFPDVLGLCHWIILERKPNGNAMIAKTLQEWEGSGLVQSHSLHTWKIRNYSSYIIVAPTGARDVSSTRIRESIGKTGNPVDQSLLPEVFAYLKDRKLYGI